MNSGRQQGSKLAAALAVSVLCLLGPLGTASAQGIVIFKTKDIGPYNQAIEGFQGECKTKVTVLDMGGDDQTGLKMVEQIRAAKPDAILAIGTKAAKISKEKFPDVPVIFCMVLNPDKNGVLGPNTTGVLLQIPYARQFLTIKTIMPSVTTVGVLFDPSKTEDNVKLAAQEAQQLGVTVVPVEVDSEKAVPNGLRDLMTKNIGLLWLTADSTVLNKDTFAYIVTATLEKNIPVMAYQSSFVKNGAFVALAPSYTGIGRQAGKMANKLIAGTKVSDIPVEPPEEDNLALNLKVAGQIGIKVPPSVVDIAEVVVQP